MATLRVHLMQNWFGYSDPAIEEALYETTILRQFAGLSLERIPDETTILNFHAVCSVEPVDGPPTFTDTCRRGAPVMRGIAAARCSQRLKY